MRPLLAVGSLALMLWLVPACKTTQPEQITEQKSSTDREAEYEAGVLVFKVKDDLKAVLPPYDHSAPTLGTYPHLGDLLPTYKVKSIAAFTPQSDATYSKGFYKIHFDTSVSLDEFIAALDRVDIIEFTEKVPVNSPKTPE